MVEDAGDEFGEFFVFAGAVDGEGVGGDGGVDCVFFVVELVLVVFVEVDLILI